MTAPATAPLDRRLSVAPMMEWTDRHCRMFLRQLTRHTLLYSEMIPLGALLHGDAERFLAFSPEERPLALQVGGSDPAGLAEAARMAEVAGYDEINLNVGCPSDRVASGRFGACLMAEPALVAECLAAMTEATRLPVTIKHRLGIDHLDSDPLLHGFIETVQRGSGCRVFVVHARKAWLSGLSPKENREIPPLQYARVRAVKAAFPDLEVILNGGVETVAQAAGLLAPDPAGRLDGVMIGRAAYQTPWTLAQADRLIFGQDTPPPSRHGAIRALLPYVEEQCAQGVPVKAITRHLMGLFHGRPGGRRWRRFLSEAPHEPGAGPEVLTQALTLVPEAESLSA
ncbi:tRNA dihydrouridine(20/20a) synthase DusA [Roseospirillum parvum]|nr:tRNA dihydrouridine(20/20a) synthase DusA [Roseospirillum parvum]